MRYDGEFFISAAETVHDDPQDTPFSLLLACLNSSFLITVNFVNSTPDTGLFLSTTWVATDLAKVQSWRWTCMQEFDMAVLRIQLLLSFLHLSMTASSTT